MPGIRLHTTRPRLRGVVSRVALCSLMTIIGVACNSSRSANGPTSSTRPTNSPSGLQVSSTSLQGSTTTLGAANTGVVVPLPVSLFGPGWSIAATEDGRAVDQRTAKACPALPGRQPSTARTRITYAHNDAPVPLVIVDRFAFATPSEATAELQRHQGAAFTQCLSTIYGRAPLALQNLVVKSLPPKLIGTGNIGYRLTGVTAADVTAEHVIFEIVVIAHNASVDVASFGGTLRDPINAQLQLKIIAALRGK